MKRAEAVHDQRTDHEQQALARARSTCRAAAEHARIAARAMRAYSRRWPPAASIAALAPAVASNAVQHELLADLALLDDLGLLGAGRQRAWRRAARRNRSCRRPACRAGTAALRRRRARVLERKPIFGRRRCIGIWPPSKPALILPLPRARERTLVAAAGGLAEARTDAAADALAILARAVGGLECIELHVDLLLDPDQVVDLC